MNATITPTYISRAADCNIAKFMTCCFDKNLSVLAIQGNPTKEQLHTAWERIMEEYSDIAGIALPDTSLKQVIVYLEARNKAVELYCFCCEASLDYIDEAFSNDAALLIQKNIDQLKKKGYNLRWAGNSEQFVKELKLIKSKESRYHVQLAQKRKELEQIEKEQNKEAIQENHRVNFIRLLNNLQKFGYHINYETTTVESLAVMVCDYSKINGDESANN